jgi:signal transduction histidine kinase
LSEPQRQSGMETIERNAEAQMALIEDLLDVSRITIGKLKVEIDVVDFAEVIREAVQSIRLAADARQLSVHTTLDSGTYVQGDFSRLRQVMFNLLNNAVKFTPDGGRIEILLKRTPSTVEVFVKDNGDGITPDFLPYVFDHFRQKDGSSTRHQGGLGIGLAIVKSVVELHGGQVQAASDGEGKGASFSVTLPRLTDVLRFPPASNRIKLRTNDVFEEQ